MGSEKREYQAVPDKTHKFQASIKRYAAENLDENSAN